jgi:hypothetical protein
VGIETTASNQLSVRPFLDDLAVINNQDSVSHTHGRKPVRDNNARLTRRELAKPLEHKVFGLGVQGSRWLV